MEFETQAKTLILPKTKSMKSNKNSVPTPENTHMIDTDEIFSNKLVMSSNYYGSPTIKKEFNLSIDVTNNDVLIGECIQGTATNLASPSQLLMSPSKSFFKSKSTPTMNDNSPTCALAAFKNNFKQQKIPFSSPTTKIEHLQGFKNQHNQESQFLALSNMLEQTNYFEKQSSTQKLPPINRLHANSTNSLFATANKLSQAEQSKIFSSYFKDMTNEEILKTSTQICSFFGFCEPTLAGESEDESAHIANRMIALSALSFLEGLKSKIKTYLKSSEKEWKLKKKQLKEEGIKCSIKERKSIEKNFEFLVSKYPPQSKFFFCYFFLNFFSFQKFLLFS